MLTETVNPDPNKRSNGVLGETPSSTNDTTNLTWQCLKQYGVGWWLRNPVLMKTLIERVAKSQFQANQDPLDAALFYLAMRKKAILVALFKTVKDTRMTDFFKNDFSQAKWQSSALKNAFVLLGKQRFEHAAAFFLLAGRLKDAIEVCVRSMHDLQLAIILVRLFESDVEHAQTIINTLLAVENLGYSMSKDDSDRLYSSPSGSAASSVHDFVGQTPPDRGRCCADPFVRSMSYWFLKDYRQALNTLYEIDLSNVFQETAADRSDQDQQQQLATLSISQVFNFYTFLKKHPLVIRQLTVDRTKSVSTANAATPIQPAAPVVRGSVLFGNKPPVTYNTSYTSYNSYNSYSGNDIATTASSDTNLTLLSTIKTNDEMEVTPIERRLHFMVAYCQLINGCPLLTLDVLSKLPNYISAESAAAAASAPLTDERPAPVASVSSAVEDLFDPFATTSVATKKPEERASMFDWSAGAFDSGSAGGGMFASRRLQDEPGEFKIEFSDDDDDEFGLDDKNEDKDKVSKELGFNWAL